MSIVAFYIYLLEEWIVVGIMFPNILQNGGFIASPQIQVFKPIFSDETEACFDNRFPIRNADENR